MLIKYPQLCNSCAKAIKEQKCLGCSGLEDVYFLGNPNCIHAKIQTVQESIRQIKINLRNGGKR